MSPPIMEVALKCKPIAWLTGDEDEVSMYFEPRRAIQEGDEINTEQPWSNTFNHILNLEPTVLIESVDGSVSETLTATYRGLGVYRVQRIFSEAEVGSSKEYTVSFLFTDAHNGFIIDASETAYPLVVSAPEQAISYNPDTSDSVLLAGERLFESTCAACHALTTVEEIEAYPTDDALVFVVMGMAMEAAELSEEEAENLARYLLALRHDAQG